MLVLKLILLSLGILLALAAGVCYFLGYLLEHPSAATGEVRAKLVERSHRKNVKMYDYDYGRKILHRVYFLKDLCKGVYEYTVDGKTYRIKQTHYGPPKDQPLTIKLTYLRRFPNIACEEFSMPKQTACAFVFTAWAIFAWLAVYYIGTK